MGAAGSALSSDLKGKVIRKDLLDQEILECMGSVSSLPDVIPVERIFNLLHTKTDVFLTHNWGNNQDNHKRVAIINNKLKERGLLTWFDSEKMEGNVKKKMTEGIDNASCVLVFVTELYIDKVRGDNAEDNCQLEFGYAARSKTAKRMIPVVMESQVRNTSAWKGEVGMVLGGLLYVDACDDLDEDKITELHDRIVSVNNGVKLSDVFKKCLTLAMEHATVSADGSHHVVVANNAHATQDTESEVYDWLVHTVKLTVKAAHACHATLSEANIGTVDRLVRRYQKNRNLLAELNIDEFDAEDIIRAITSGQSANNASSSGTVASVLPDEPQGGDEATEGLAAEEEEVPSSGFSDNMNRVMVSTHDHPLSVFDSDNGWGCDGRHLEGGCRQGCTDFHQTYGWTRFHCPQCDYDMCVGCVTAYFESDWTVKPKQTSIHNHTLQYLDPDNSGWACDGRKQPGGCTKGCTGFRQMGEFYRYSCKACNFDLCPGCTAKYEMK